ncbi:MAG: MBL fold metallo-hydrolase [Dehalococcoidales bacterium]|nr:MBL fold metallo-hydrolase [Dehalococcoidales bacterium]
MKLTDNIYFYPETGMLDANTYVIKDEMNILVDPGASRKTPSLVRAMQKDGIKPEDIKIILNTHLHLDHYEGCQDFKKLSGARILIHPKQEEFYDYSVNQVAQFFGMPVLEFKADAQIEADIFKNSPLGLEIVYAPGHSSDSICFYSKKEKFLVCGDVIFQANTGRVDFPGGSAARLKQSIEELSKMDIEYLLPGHMDIIAGADNVKKNFQYVKNNVFEWL